MRQVPKSQGGRIVKKIKLVLLSAAIISSILGSSFAIGLIRAAPAAAQFTYTATWFCTFALLTIPPGTAIPPLRESVGAAAVLGFTPGAYMTDVKIRNPSFTTSVTIGKDIRLTYSEIQGASSFSANLTRTLKADSSFSVDCQEIADLIVAGHFALPDVAKGFVIVIAPTSHLNVVATHTAIAVNGTTNECIFSCPTGALVATGVSVDVEHIPAEPLVP